MKWYQLNVTLSIIVMGIGGSRAGQSGNAPIMVLVRGLSPSPAAEGIVKGDQWITEISRFFL